MQLDVASPPVSTRTIMWLASCAKLVTTVAALQCVERGLFQLDDFSDVDRLLPEWSSPFIISGLKPDGTPDLIPAKEKITLRRLLSHASGIAYDFLVPDLMAWRKSRNEGSITTQANIIDAFAIPLVAEPDSTFTYGGGVDVAGLMVARANGCTLEEYMRKNIFDVLGMNDTSFHVTHNDIGNQLMPMTTRLPPNEHLVAGLTKDAPFLPTLAPNDHFGGIGLFGHTEDFLKLLKSVLRNDGQLLKSHSIDTMFTPSLSAASQDVLNQALSIPPVAAIMIPGEPPIGTLGAGEWTYGLGGIIALHDAENGLKAGNMRWGGAPNLKWWIDRKGGTCGIFSTQLYPTGEQRHALLGKMFQEDVIRRFT